MGDPLFALDLFRPSLCLLLMSAVIPQLERLHIEVTNVCNFKCEFCPDGIMQRRRGHMEPALLEQILEEVAATGLARVMVFT